MTRSDRERRLDEEIRHHVEMATAAHIRDGMPPDEARRVAMLALGAVEHFKDEARDQFRSRFWSSVRQDLRHALGSARRSPGYTAIVVATFALGIGANTAMFTLINTVLLRPLPYAQPNRLVIMTSESGGTSAPDFLDLRSRNTAFSSMTLLGSSRATLTGGGDPEEVVAEDVSTGFFATVGVQPWLGRDFTADEENDPGTAVILSHALWVRRYGGDRSIVGRNIVVDGRGIPVVGVAPAQLDRNLAGDIYRPFDFRAPHATVRAYRPQLVIARLRPGVAITAAGAAMNVVEKQLGTVYHEDARINIRLQRYDRTIVGGVRAQLLYLLAAVIIVLMIACGNVASLMLARSTARHAELATRAALGASRSRLIQQLVTETTLLAVAGGALGLAFAILVLRALQLDAVTALPRTTSLTPNLVTFAFTALLSLAAGAIVGAGAAWRAATMAVYSSLASGGWSSHSRGGMRFREGVVAFQLVASLVLLASASVLLESFWHLAHVSPGFDERNLVTGTIVMPADRYTFPNAVQWWTTFLPQVASIPHVVGVTAASQIPFQPGGNASYVPAGATTIAGVERPSALINVVADRYFETMHIQLTGNTFSKDGPSGDFAEIVVSQSVARRLAPFGRAIGQQMTFPDFGGFTGQVVGVAGDVRADLGRDPPDIIYFPVNRRAGWARQMHLLVRTDGDPLPVVPQIRRLVAQRDPLLAVGHVRTMADIVGSSVARQRLDTGILGGFGAAALLLSALGLYGLLTYAVATRRQEFSIRLALGAQRGQLFRLVVANGVKLVSIGLGVGLLLAPMATRVLQRAFDTAPINGTVVVASAVILGSIGLCASVVPALRATRVDTLRSSL